MLLGNFVKAADVDKGFEIKPCRGRTSRRSFDRRGLGFDLTSPHSTSLHYTVYTRLLTPIAISILLTEMAGFDHVSIRLAWFDVAKDARGSID